MMPENRLIPVVLREKLGLHREPTVIPIRTFKAIYNVEMFIRAIPLALMLIKLSTLRETNRFGKTLVR